jgi:hypothetical protein
MQKEEKAVVRRKHKINLAKVLGWIMICLGATTLALSILYAAQNFSQMLAVTGLGLTFWGAILTYIQTESYVKENLLDATVLPSLATVNQMLQELNYKGDALYLPPKYFTNPEVTKIYISKRASEKLPNPEQIQKHENQFFIENPNGILLTPPGFQLTKILEKNMETSFTKIDLPRLQLEMPKLFIEDMEIAENFEIEILPIENLKEIADSVLLVQVKDNLIHVKITSSIYKDICKETGKLSKICGVVGCPLCSSIACALAKASGNIVKIEKTETTENGKTIEAYYRIIEEKS